MALVFASADFGLSWILEVVSLVFVGWFIAHYVLPPLRRAMDKRAQTIASQLSAGEEARVKAVALVAQRRTELEAARQQAQLVVDQARQSAELLEKDGERLAQEDYTRAVARAEAEVQASRARLEAEIMAELAGIIITASFQVVQAELDEHAHHRLIDQAIVAAETEAR